MRCLMIYSPHTAVRANAVTLVSKLFSWRLQVLSQTFIFDRSRRRPFRMARRPISFVASDVGTARYVPPELPEQARLQVGASLPPELRGRLLDLGWAENRNEEEQEAQRWDRAPISLLPSTDLELLGINPSAESTGDAEGRQNKGLLRRKSSGAGHISGMRKKGIFVPPLLSLVPVIANLLTDPDMTVSSMANDLIMMLMKDDPVLLVRSLMEDMSDAMQDHEQALNTLRLFAHAQERLPPGLAHHVFNHLAGLVRTTARQSSQDIAFVVARCLPILVDLVPQVCEMSYRELCRNKLDPLILPTLAPIPSGLKLSARSSMTPGLMQAAMTRTAQNLILFNVIQQSPKDINAIRKPYNQLAQLAVELEDVQDLRPTTITDYVPKRQRVPHSAEELQFLRMTSPLARSYLLMCTEIFKSLSRHMNNHSELGKYMDGINRIVLLRGNDIGIVALALIGMYPVLSSSFPTRLTMIPSIHDGQYSIQTHVLVGFRLQSLHAGPNQGLYGVRRRTSNPTSNRVQHAALLFPPQRDLCLSNTRSGESHSSSKRYGRSGSGMVCGECFRTRILPQPDDHGNGPRPRWHSWDESITGARSPNYHGERKARVASP